ncbi:phage tail tape measure protein [Viridibacillus arvi]|uniref:phage tail tape measure protein n=1 Tax=Viridibacillus arvi TaxID=263475 RepID=UPI0034CF1CEE
MADAEVGNLRVSLSMNSATFERSLASIDRSIKTLGQEMSIVRNRGREWGNTTDGLRTKQETLTRLLSSQEAKVRALRTAYERSKQETGENSAATERLATQLNRAVAEYTRTETEINDVTAAISRQEEELRRSQSSWQRAGEAMQRVGQTMQKVGDKMKSVGQSMSLYVSAPITAMAGGAVKAAIDFESAFAGVRKTVDTSEEGFKKLETGIREMSKALPTSASDIAAVAESAGQLGIAEDSILSFTRTIIDLGESTNLTREQAASEFARFANIVGMSQKDFDKLGSSIVGLGNTMATTESEIMSMAMRLAAQGNQVGMTEDQILALSATMSSLGIEAEAGGTAMTTVLKKIDKAVGAGGKSLEAFASAAGLSSADFKNAFEKDAVGALDMFIKGLSKSSKNGENLTTILDGLGIKGIREADTLLRMAGASDLLSSAVKTSSDAWKENTALSNEAEQRYKTTASQLGMLKNKLTDVGITIGNILIPILMQMVDKVTPIIEGFSKLSQGTQEFILVVGGIAAAIGPALIIIGTLIKSIGAITTALAPVSLAISEAGGLMGALGTAMTAIVSPIGIAVFAIAGIGAALVLAYNKVGWFRDGVNDIWNKIKDLTSTAFSAIKSTINNVISGIVTFGKSLLDKFKGFWDENGKFISSIVKTHFNQVKSTIEMVMGIIKGVFQAVWPSLSAIVKVAWALIKTVVSTALDIILGVIQTIMKVIQGDWKGAWESIKKTAKTIMDGIVKNFKDINLKQVAIDIIQGLINGFNSMKDAVEKKIRSIANLIPDGIKKLLDIRSPSRVTTKLGEHTGQGFANGIGNKEKEVSRSANKLATAAQKEFNKKMQKLDLKLTAGKINVNQYTKSLESMKTQYSGVANAIEKIDAKIAKTRESSSKKQLAALTKTFNNEMSKLSLNFKAKKIDTSEYIKSLESMKNSYKGVANANAKIDAQIATLRKNNIKEMFKDDKADYAAKKKDKEVSMTEELSYLKEVTKHYKKNTEERTYFENLAKQKKQEITAAKKKIDDDYLKNVQELNQKLIDGENKLKEEYKKAVDDRAKSLYSFAGLFDEIAEKAEVSGQQLIANLQGQVDTFKNWSENIASLTSKGIDEGLLAELQAMGPQAGAEIAALNTLSDEQLSQYTALWKEKSKLARDQAVGELEGMRIETAKKIDQLNRDTKKQLKEYQAEWKASMKTVTRNTKSELSVMPDIGSYAVQGLIDGMNSRKAELERIAAELGAIVSGTVKDSVGMSNTSSKSKSLGINVSQNLMQGIQESTAKLKQALANTYSGLAMSAQSMMGVSTTNNSNYATTENRTINNTYNMTYQSPKPLDPYEASRMTRNSMKELGLQF